MSKIEGQMQRRKAKRQSGTRSNDREGSQKKSNTDSEMTKSQNCIRRPSINVNPSKQIKSYHSQRSKTEVLNQGKSPSHANQIHSSQIDDLGVLRNIVETQRENSPSIYQQGKKRFHLSDEIN